MKNRINLTACGGAGEYALVWILQTRVLSQARSAQRLVVGTVSASSARFNRLGIFNTPAKHVGTSWLAFNRALLWMQLGRENVIFSLASADGPFKRVYRETASTARPSIRHAVLRPDERYIAFDRMRIDSHTENGIWLVDMNRHTAEQITDEDQSSYSHELNGWAEDNPMTLLMMGRGSVHVPGDQEEYDEPCRVILND